MYSEMDMLKAQLDRLENKYDLALTERPIEARQKKLDMWKSLHGGKYKEYQDLLLMHAHICEHLWEDKECKIPESTWNAKYDDRGKKYREELMKEIHEIIENEVTEIKSQRQRSTSHDL